MPTPLKNHLKGKRSRSTLFSMLSLASSRWRQTWFLLSIMTLGMIAAVIIVCAFPLFTDIMNTAGLRQELRSAPDSAEIQWNTVTLGLSTPVATAVRNEFADLVKQDLGSVVHLSQFEIISFDYSFATATKSTRTLTMYGASMQQASSHFGHIEGRLAQITTAQQQELEVMMTPDSAKLLGLKVGDTFPLQLGYYLVIPSYSEGATRQTQLITARVAGLFNVDAANASYWHGEDFKHLAIDTKQGTSYAFTMVVPNESLLAIADGLSAKYQQQQQQQSAQANKQPPAIYTNGVTLRWYYQVDAPGVSIGQLDTLINNFATFQGDYTSTYGMLEDGNGPPRLEFPYLHLTHLTSSLLSTDDTPSNLERFRSRMDVAQVPTMVLTIQIVLLILFFISLMTSLLIESQANAIALLRSRGASSSQIFGSLFTHCAILGGVAFCAGIPLTMLAVSLLAQHFLPAGAQDAITLVTAHPWQAAQKVVWYAVGMLLVMLVTMMSALYFATRMDVLALRRDASRTNKRPLWQRFNLDVLAGVVAIVGYGISLYLNSISDLLQGDAHTLIITPLSVIAPFFLVLGCLFILLRVFPLLLRLGAWLAGRGRGAASMLALAQVSRAPRMSIRMTMLLALSIAFLLFTMVYQSTQAQHIQDLTNYLAGADFSGYVDPMAQTTTYKPYQTIPGVASSSIGYVGTGRAGAADLSMQIRAVDATSFGHTVIWPSPDADRAGNALLQKMISLDKNPLMGTVVPAIVDTTTVNQLHLHVGSVFVLTVDQYDKPAMTCIIVGMVAHIPTVSDKTSLTQQGKTLTVGSILMDYATYIKDFNKLVKQDPSLNKLNPPAPNHVWLHSRDDAAAVASVRSALSKLHLASLVDRRAILAELNADPLYLILSGILSIGTVAALLLALVGNLLTSWLSARTRLTNFAVLRAIGSSPRQVASVLTWEQAIVYLTGLLLGVGIGAFIVQAVIPALTITNLNTDVSSDQFYTLQSAFPAQIVMPTTLLPALVVLLAIYGIALVMMVRIVSQPSLSQTLRLNED